MGINPWLVAFAPIRLMTAGGFLAVSYLKNRDSTGDIDFLLDPEYAGDKEIKNALRETATSVANELQYNEDWLNEAMSIFVSAQSRRVLFKRAEDQGIALFKGQHLEILAAPIEWALERKLRRIYAADRERKTEADIDDAVALLRRIRELEKGPLDLEAIRQMNLNGFDVTPDHGTMERVAKAYHDKFGESVFKDLLHNAQS